MNNNLIYSLLFTNGAYLYFRFHKWWLSIRKEKEEVLNPDFKFVGVLKDWVIILILILAALSFLIKGL
ncbi:MAG: hypothetical protein ACI8W0_000819 [Flavobacterium sp.]|jgi:hypothetical protein